jgi:hypothetical protein
MSANENIENQAGGNSSLPKGNPFQAPDGYFEKFPLRISERIIAKNTINSKRTYYLLRPVFAVVVSAVILIAGFAVFSTMQGKINQSNSGELGLSYFLGFDDSDEAELADAVYYAALEGEVELSEEESLTEQDLLLLEMIHEEMEWELYDYYN